ncbi:hypothetical protein LCGC14_1419570 [marine sediment metagenome]|uniref:Uncharacterized protein n=1 Tax=marine sediment metagenome TaxID=412755 RepID=A0A0F9MTH1_9ZZZZ
MIKSEPKEMRAMSAKYFAVIVYTDDVKWMDITAPESYKLLETFLSDDKIISIDITKKDFKYKVMKLDEN